MSRSRIRGSVDALVSTLSDVARDEPLDLSCVCQPTLLLWGEKDRWPDLGMARSLQEQLPNAQLRVIGKARHMVMEERAAESNEAILTFLLGERVDAVAGTTSAAE